MIIMGKFPWKIIEQNIKVTIKARNIFHFPPEKKKRQYLVQKSENELEI